MKMKIVASVLAIAACQLLCVAVTSAEQPTNAPVPTAADVDYFEKKIRPLLVKRCYVCHSKQAKTVHGGFKLDSAAGLFRGGDSGIAVVPGKPDESPLIQGIRYGKDADFQMPPKGRLPDREIAELEAWVKRGAPFPVDANPTQTDNKIDFKAARNFWSFRNVEEQVLPKTKQSDWARQRIDHFVLSGIEQAGLQPAPEADRETMIRRLSFDLIGLPPTPEEVEAFVKDESDAAYEKLVERLLGSPHFGERWARMWLDMARYTDRTASWLYSTGQAHLYRDWVVRAMNEDVPFDQFVHRQLATDMMPETGPEDVAALGFIGLSPNYWKELKLPTEIIKVIVADEWEERVDVVSRTFLGLTVACARCHDHKFDPISTQDYYALAGVFASCRLTERPLIDDKLYEPVKKAKTEVAKLEKQLAALKKKKPQPEDDIKKLTEQIAKLKATPHYNAELVAAVVEESLYVERVGKRADEGTKLVYKPEPRDLNLFIRGNPNRLGEVVPRRFLTVLSGETSKPYQQGSGRLELAHAITRDAAALTSRVIVNRIWLAHFGRGIVTTPSNFGQSGERPSHPELLDDLAARFIKHGWSLKQLHREIVLSAAYRQSARREGPSVEKDPGNRWLARMTPRRLQVEAWRDAMLAVSGQLDLTIGGASVALTDNGNRRRTLYGTIHRRDMSKMLLTHDFPDPTAHSPKRTTTTTAIQGLYALNGPMLMARSETLAKRLQTDISGDNPEAELQRIQRAYRLLFSREPTSGEVELGLSFLGETTGSNRQLAWAQYAQVLLVSNEFLYVD